jgi:methionyl-tRNA formyltransferase
VKIASTTPRFAFLALEEHPWARAMLQSLLARGHITALIVQETSPVSEEERAKFLTRMAGQPIAPEMREQAQAWNIPVETVPSHNDLTCRDLLAAARPGLVVLGGTRIIRRNILEPSLEDRPVPFVNAHPGLLPWLRGSASVGWALYLDRPIGATVHFIDPGIDTGDLILREPLPVYRSDTYETLNYRVAALAARLMAETLDRFRAGNVPRQPQNPAEGQTFRVIPEDLLAEGIARLREGRYSHFAEA